MPSDNRFFLTTFGGGTDTQGVACRGFPIADGSWYYAADSQRWPCGTKLRITNPANGRTVIAQVADEGPALYVEQRAGGSVLDASPLVSEHLFDSASSGWEDHRGVYVQVADPSTPLGPDISGVQAGPPVVTAGTAGLVFAAAIAVAATFWWRARKAKEPVLP